MLTVPIEYRPGEKAFQVTADKRKIMSLLVEGVSLASADEMVGVLRAFRQRRRTRRRTVKIGFLDERLSLLKSKSIQVQKLSNRKFRDRLPVAALALALRRHYDLDINDSINNGVVSNKALDRIASDSGSFDFADPWHASPQSGNSAMPQDEPAKDSQMLVKAEMLTVEEGRKRFRFDSPPPVPGRVLTNSEAKDKFEASLARMRQMMPGL